MTSPHQLLCHLSSGEVHLAKFPLPEVRPGQVLVRVHHSIVSAGTERMLVGFARQGWLARAKSQPDRVRQVLQRVQAQGFFAAYDAVKGRLDTPLPLGYAASGTVIAVGDGVDAFASGDRVACNGSHADIVQVPWRLCAKVPDDVPLEQACFTTLASIALHGVRLAQVELGERVLVIGAGLIGSLTIDLLRAAAVEVSCSEPDEARRQRVEAHDSSITVYHTPQTIPEASFDAVLVCAASDSAEPMRQAVLAARKRGRVVMVGTGSLDVPRDVMYDREVRVQVASSYGAGRYEAAYEEQGLDYPMAYVRWTAQRNFEAVLGLMARGRLDPGWLITHTAPFEQASAPLYTAWLGLTDAPTPSLAARFDYHASREANATTFDKKVFFQNNLSNTPEEVRVGVIGAGLYAQRTFLPALQKVDAGLHLTGIVSRGGTDAAWLAKREGFAWASARREALYDAREAIELVAILTRHDAHAALVTEALSHGKHVFVEKPLATNLQDLAALMRLARERERTQRLMVGFNRRFAPMTRALIDALDALGDEARSSCHVAIRVNAGALPADHWLHAEGGRLLGEAVHFIDLARAIVGESITRHAVMAAHDGGLITLGFARGATASIDYVTSGSPARVKETVEVSCDARSALIEGWKKLSVWDWPELSPRRQLRGDKGHEAMCEAMIAHVRGDADMWSSLDELEEVSRVAIEVAEGARFQRRGETS